MWKLGVMLFAPLLACSCPRAVAPPGEPNPVVLDPSKGVVLGDEVVTCTSSGSLIVEIFAHSIDKDQVTQGRRCSESDRSPFRWQLDHNALWVSSDCKALNPPSPPGVGGRYLQRIDMAEFSKKGEYIFHRQDSRFSDNTPAALLGGDVYSSNYFLYYDYLPAGKAQARQFMVTNLTSKPIDRERDFKDGNPPSSVFSSYISDSHWDAKEGAWKEHPWKLEWSIPPTFQEPFQALGLGDDFYFVTRSGTLFRAAKTAKGKDRTLALVWDGKERPIKAFVSDAKTGKTFLFVPPAKEGGRRAFFELSAEPKLEEYDPKLVPLPKLEEPHRTILHDARILVALKKIAGKAAPKADGDKKP